MSAPIRRPAPVTSAAPPIPAPRLATGPSARREPRHAARGGSGLDHDARAWLLHYSRSLPPHVAGRHEDRGEVRRRFVKRPNQGEFQRPVALDATRLTPPGYRRLPAA